MLKRFLTSLPQWFLSLLTVLAILWLTLAPRPLGDDPPQLFEGADKIVHGIMFGGLTAMLLLDWQRKHFWREEKWLRALIYAVGASLFGIFIEFAQASMGLGRGLEVSDMIADTIGSFIFAIIWMFLQSFWTVRMKK